MENMSVLLVGSILPEANLHFLGTQAGLVEDVRTKKLLQKMNDRCKEGGLFKHNTKAEG